MLDDDEKDRFVEAIFYDLITVAALSSSLPRKVYTSTADRLKQAIYKGYKGTLMEFEFGKPDYLLLKELRTNIYIFSGAKTATQVQDIKSLMYEGERVLNYSEFKKLARERFDVYNGSKETSYLESEYITAHTTASSAATYREALANEQLFPYLRSVAIIDQYTAPECSRMNGIVAEVGSPIWNHNLAPRHFRCRCHEEKIDKYEKVKVTPDEKLKDVQKQNDESMQDVFKMNPVKDKVVFNRKHPYFDITKRYPDLAKMNWGLPIPNTDE